MAKAKRMYFWYRPKHFHAAQSAITDSDRDRQRDEYIAWLAKARGVSVDAAKTIAFEQRDRAPIISSSHEDGCYERKIIDIGVRGTHIRVVPCFTDKRGFYQPTIPTSPYVWSRSVTGGAGVTVYWVVHNGKQVDSFLTMARAKECALRLAA